MAIKPPIVASHEHESLPTDADPVPLPPIVHETSHETGGSDALGNLAAGVITTGTLDGDRLPAISTSKKGAVPAVTPSGKFMHDSNAFLELATVGIAPITPYAGQIWCDPVIGNPGIIIPDVVIPGSGIDVYAVAALHFNGGNGSTDFIDSSLSPKAFTAHGDAVIYTTLPKFGTGSGKFGGAGWIDTLPSAGFGFGTGNFTIDFWMKCTVLSVNATLMGLADSLNSQNSDRAWEVRNSTTDLGFFYNGALSGQFIYVCPLATAKSGVWVHIAIVRNGVSLRGYTNGTLFNEGILAPGFSFNTSTKKFAIGRPGEFNDRYYGGQIDELRISKSIARWTADFTPPVAEYA